MRLLKEDDGTARDEAASGVWIRYHEQLLKMIRRRLANSPRARIVRDEYDVALSVFDKAIRAIRRGDFEQLADRNDLWQILMVLSKRSVVDLIRRTESQKRGGGRVRDESSLTAPGEEGGAGLDALPGAITDPAIAAAAAEDFDRLLKVLGDDSLREIALLRMDDHTPEAIAKMLGCSVRNVFNKLKLIRMKWENEGA